MLILDQNQEGLALLRRRPAKPSIIAGCLFGALACVPVVSGAEMSGTRVVTTAGLALVALCLIWLGRPSDIKKPLPAEFAKSRLPAAALIELGGSDSYQARLVRSDGSSLLLFERSEPAGVVHDVLALTNRYSLPVRPGWMLDDVAWAVLSQPSSAARAGRGLSAPIVTESWPLERQRTAAYTTLWAGLFILVVSIAMAVSPYRSGVTPSLLSVMLPLLTIVYVLLVGAWLLGLRQRVTFRATGLEQLRTWFKRPLGRVKTVEVKIHAVFPVGPKSASIRHALVVTEAGLLAYPVDIPVAEQLAFADHDIGRAAGRAAE
jgi:hypothetical protein